MVPLRWLGKYVTRNGGTTLVRQFSVSAPRAQDGECDDDEGYDRPYVFESEEGRVKMLRYVSRAPIAEDNHRWIKGRSTALASCSKGVNGAIQ
jgi:hypothetical protein